MTVFYTVWYTWHVYSYIDEVNHVQLTPRSPSGCPTWQCTNTITTSCNSYYWSGKKYLAGHKTYVATHCKINSNILTIITLTTHHHACRTYNYYSTEFLRPCMHSTCPGMDGLASYCMHVTQYGRSKNPIRYYSYVEWPYEGRLYKGSPWLVALMLTFLEGFGV